MEDVASIKTVRRSKSGNRSRLKKRGKRTMPALVIEGVAPQVDCGRHPVKCIVGDTVAVSADVYKDGHDLVGARLCFRPANERTWRYAPMTYDYDHDRWSGSFVPDRIGRWVYTVEAWTDVLGTWRSDLRKKADAGADVSVDLAEGVESLEQLRRKTKGAARESLRTSIEALRDDALTTEDRLRTALSPKLEQLLSEQVDEASVTRFDRELGIVVDRTLAGFAAWYELFPRSQGKEPGVHGRFADAARRLPELAELGFDVIYLPPIHAVGHTNRKGPNNTLTAGPNDPGSPWAIGSADGGHTAVEPQLGSIEDFEDFVAHARSLGMEVALDYALQCSPDHPWAKEHPDWFFIRPDGSIKYAENPPKKYQDIYPLNFWCDNYQDLWNACRDIFLFWMEKGVRVFRVDNPHTKPLAFWEWVIGEIQAENPDVVFLSEAFTRPNRMKGLAKLGFTQSYTYFTWRNTPQELRDYLTELTTTEMAHYYRPNFFANTPDILHEYLQTGGRPAFRVRLVLAATLSPLYGIYSGFELCENTPKHAGSEEYLDSEKYQIRVRDWDAPGNIKADIARINRIRRGNAALQRLTNLSFHLSENDQILFYHKAHPGNDLLVAVNLDPHRAQDTMVHVPIARLGVGPDEPYTVHDLLTGDRYVWRGVRNYVRLDPAFQVAHVLRVEGNGR